MTTNKPNVQRYDNTGCPEEICRVDTMHESDDGDYVLYEDYEALQAECDKLMEEVLRLRVAMTNAAQRADDWPDSNDDPADVLSDCASILFDALDYGHTSA